jgi:hypothetical protein
MAKEATGGVRNARARNNVFMRNSFDDLGIPLSETAFKIFGSGGRETANKMFAVRGDYRN